jgi:uncharacterized protein (TIGR02391 family)
MILTDDEMRQIRKSIEAQAGLDEELIHRCGHLIHMGSFDEAVRSAFILLEERLRQAVNEEGMTGTVLANHAFNSKSGPLAKLLGHTPSEREGLRELYSGAFKLFRNPTAHSVVGYTPAEGKAIIGLVDLLLKMLKRAAELPPPGLFSENVQKAINDVEQGIGPSAASQFRAFLGKCLRIGIKPSKTSKQWIPFKRYAFVKYEHWEEPRRYRIPMFYITAGGSSFELEFSVNTYYSIIIGFDLEPLVEELTELGFRPYGKKRNLIIDLRMNNDQTFFDSLFDLVVRMSDELEETLR